MMSDSDHICGCIGGPKTEVWMDFVDEQSEGELIPRELLGIIEQTTWPAPFSLVRPSTSTID